MSAPHPVLSSRSSPSHGRRQQALRYLCLMSPECQMLTSVPAALSSSFQSDEAKAFDMSFRESTQ